MSGADHARRDNALLRLARMGGRSPAALAGEAGVLAFVVLLLIVPVVLAISSGFAENGRPTLYWFRQALGEAVYLDQLLNGLALAAATTLVSLAIALPLAVLRARCRFPGQGLLGLLLLLPLILPPFVGALAMRHLFGQFGSLNLLLDRLGVLDFGQSLPPDWLGAGFAGVVVLQSLHLFPILYLNASAALANIDPAYAQAARNLGAGCVTTFARITLPLMRPGLFAGATIIFIWSFTDVGTPLIMGYNDVVPVTIFKELAKSETTPSVFSLVFLMLLVSASLYVAGKLLFGRSTEGQATKASIAQEPRRLHGWSAAGAWLLHGGVILAALLPHVGVVLTAVSARWVNTILPSEYTWRHLRFVFEREQTVRSVFNSLQYSSVSTAIDLVMGCAAAWLIVRSRVLGRNLLDAMTMLPLAVPGLILASGLVALTAGGPLEAIGPRNNPFLILVAAYAIRRLPFVVRGVSAGLQQVSVSLEEAARNLGSGRARTALRITLPLVAANVVAAGVLTFAFAMLEVSDSLILAQTQKYYPITKEIYTQAASGNADAANLASALGVYSMLFLGGMLGLASLLMGKRLGAIFRA